MGMMMARFQNRQYGVQRQRGFSLIEAMFSALILGIALLALAGFHVGAFQDGALVKSRMAATNLAQEKLDDLRSFTRLQDDPDTTAADECAAGTFCFSEIAENAGGQEKTAGALRLPSGSVTGFLDNYSRTWTVTCATSETIGSALSFGTTCTNAIAKLVRVRISWTDNKNITQEVALQSVIYSMDPANGANVAVSPSGKGPKITYTPNNDSVPIEIGGGKSTETSKPLPEVSGGDSRRVTLPSVVYTGSSGSETVVSKEEFATVNCTCNLKSAQGTARTPHRTVWNGSALEQEKGEQVTKVVGQPSDLSNSGTTNQDPLCIECCRDHHDTNIDADNNGEPDYPAYRPYIAPDQFSSTTGDHKHFTLGGTEVTSTADVYVEACRMKRVDGIWRVAADWRLIELAAYGCDYFVGTPTDECPPTATPVTEKLNAYKDWVKAVLKSFVGYLGDNQTVDTASTALPAFSSGVNPLLDVNSDNIYVLYGGNKQLITRGIYADVVFKKKGSGAPREVDTDYVEAVLPVSSNSDFTKLQYLPFYDANLTLLAKWSPTSTNESGNNNPPKPGDCSPTAALLAYGTTPDPSAAVCVTSEAIDTIDDPTLDYFDDFYSRGKLYGKLSSGSTLITASVARGNNGLTSSPSINGTTDTVQTRTVKATISGNGVSGSVIRGNSGVDLSKVTIVASPGTGVTCVFTNPSTLATASNANFSCTTPNGWSGTLTFSDSDTASSYSFSPYATTPTIAAPKDDIVVTAYGDAISVYGRVFYTGSTDTQVAITTSTGQTCTISGTLVTCAGVPLTSGTWSGTVTITNKTSFANYLDVGTATNVVAVANDCSSADGTGAKSTGTLTNTGQGDIGSVSAPTAFSFCAK